MMHRLILTLSFLYLAITNAIWISQDTRPPFWDMAYHSSAAIRIYEAFERLGLKALVEIPSLTGFYPPLFQSIVAFSWALFGKSEAVARTANLGAIAILLVATYGIGKRLLSPLGAAMAAVCASFYPIMLWLSRETILDYWLTAMVAASIWALLRTEEFKHRGRSLLFGLICGLGMLTKWTFPLFVVWPALWLARRQWKNAALSAMVAAAVAAYWFVPAGASLLEFQKINAAGGVTEGDPSLWSWQAFVFYLRALEGYQLFLPLFLLFLAGLVILWRQFEAAWIPILLWAVGGWIGLMFFLNKDPRYSAPLLPAVALVTALTVDRRESRAVLLACFLVFQHYLVSFGLKSIPETVVLSEGSKGAESWNWNLYTQTYMDLWGKPAKEDWKIGYVLDQVSRNASNNVQLGIVPDIPRFDALAFEFYIALWKKPVMINRLWAFNESAIRANDYVLFSEDPGFAQFFAPELDKVKRYILNSPQVFELVESFKLPSGQTIRLYRVSKNGQ